MKEKILRILENSKDYVSGQSLCQKLGISRTAVWKNINSLKAKGYVIDAVNNKGYKLLSSPDLMRPEDISPYLNTKVFGRKIEYYEETDSTNLRAKKAGDENGTHGSLFVADRQSLGRGRRGRNWDSPKGTSIFMTYLLRPDIEIGSISRLTIVAAVAVARAVNQVAGIKAGIKWPNDVVVNGKKICGILTEMSSEGMDINHVIMGIGINVNNTDFPEELKDKATSIYLETGEKLRRAKLIGEITNNLELLCNKFEQEKSLSFILEEYNQLLVSRNKKVVVIEKDSKTEYVALGLSVEGGLLVKDRDGNEKNIISGEVSVRGIYGYV